MSPDPKTTPPAAPAAAPAGVAPDERAARVLASAADALDALLEGGLPDLIPGRATAAAPEPAGGAVAPDDVDRIVDAVNRLIGFLGEIDDFVVPLAQGDLSAPLPSRDNLLASPFKELHSRLSELTFKTAAIARGDYTQRVDFMGEFSQAFNSMVDLLAEREDELQRASLLDDLTGLWNRRGLFALGDQEIREAARSGQRLALVFADLDGLKAINDSLGHEEGDRALRQVGEILRETSREADIPARIGGDEFVVVLHGGGDAADELARRFETALAHASSAPGRPHPYPLTASLGKAVVEPGSGETLVAVLARADRLMYEVKKAKRSRRPKS